MTGMLDESIGGPADPGAWCVMQCPAVLSLSVGLESALPAIHQFDGLVRSGARAIVLDFSAVQEIYLGAGAVLLARAREAKEAGIHIRVLLPERADLRDRLAVCGLANVLEDASTIVLPESAILALDRTPREPEWNDARLEREASLHASRVSRRLRRWLSEHNYSLDKEFEENFLHIVGETLDNAVHHSQAGWWVCADLRVRQDRPPLLEVAIFNFGSSMGESMDTIPDTSQTRHEIHSLREEHRRRENFGARWTEHNLLGLFAIQDGNSRFGAERGRGGGTHRIVETFQEISNDTEYDKECRLGWVSGRTAIYLDGRYQLGPSRIPTRASRDDIAFNPPNDLHETPDHLAVVNLDPPFPGTLLKLEFPLRADYLANQKV